MEAPIFNWRRDWSPFRVVPAAEIHTPAYSESPRSLRSPEGVGDRVRAAAFAEVQAEAAFLWAADKFGNDGSAPDALVRAWRMLAAEERKHAGWLLKRLEELGQEIPERELNDQLWRTLVSKNAPQEFAVCMAIAEERGRRAGERFYDGLRELDSATAEIFRQIAFEERAHIELAYKFFPEAAAAGMPSHTLV